MTTEGEPMSGETQDVGLSESERSELHTAMRGWARDLCLTTEAPETVVERLIATHRATAWDEGWVAGLSDASLPLGRVPTKNPHRAALDTPREDQP